MAFIDLTKAFDIVNRDLNCNILRKFSCPPTFIATLQQFHTGMCAQVAMAGSQSSSFPVEVGVKQGCVLAPIMLNLLIVAITFVSHRDRQSSDCVGVEYRLDGGLFNLLLVAITFVSHRDRQSSDCVGIEYHLDGGLFNLRRLQAKTKTSSAVISALQYADDAAFPSLTADRLQYIRLLEPFHIRRLQLILRLCWWHKVTHSEIRSRAGIPSNPYSSIASFAGWAMLSECLIADCPIVLFMAN